jgi:NAD(P)-dependent dehydrogenase (short-subunit alcohol dehydrogenase family)
VDVRQPEEAAAIVNATVSAFGKIDILVNNAGGPPFGTFESFDEAAWQSAFEGNLLSTVRFSRLVIPHMRKTGSGRIINIVSLSVKTFLANSVLSTSLRMGVVGMAKMLSNELGPDQITVNNVAPGIDPDGPGQRDPAIHDPAPPWKNCWRNARKTYPWPDRPAGRTGCTRGLPGKPPGRLYHRYYHPGGRRRRKSALLIGPTLARPAIP